MTARQPELTAMKSVPVCTLRRRAPAMSMAGRIFFAGLAQGKIVSAAT